MVRTTLQPSTPSTPSLGIEMPLSEHLEELRARLIRSVLYLALGMVAGWILYPAVYPLLWAPVERLLAEHPDWAPVLPDLTQAFTLRLQISFYTGLLLASR